MSERKEWNSRPPSLDAGLWDKIPLDRKQDFYELAARQLRAGFHPNATARKYLLDLGIIKPAVVNKAPEGFFKRARAVPSAKVPSVNTPPARRAPLPAAPNVASAVSSFKKGFKPKIADEPDVEEDAVFTFDDDVMSPPIILTEFPDFEDADVDRKPTRPFGLRTIPAVGDVPKGRLGHAIHRLLGLPGEPGKKAAEAEASVLSAIAADPAYAAMEPSQLGNLGCSVPEYVLSSIEDLILEEVMVVIRDIEARRENSDPTVVDWLPPDEWA